jgi:uncharacterized protein (TIGR03083 family)
MTQENPTREQILAAYDAEEAALKALFARVGDEQWSGPTRDDGWTVHDIVAHIGDTAHGLSSVIRMTPEQIGGLDIHALNQQRREQNKTRPRAEVEQHVSSGFATARKAASPDLNLAAASPIPGRSVGQLLYAIALHAAGHRQEIEALLG